MSNRKPHTGIVLNDLTLDEIEAYKAKVSLNEQSQFKGNCLWCQTAFRGRPDKKFCSNNCRSKYHTASLQIALDKAHAEIADLRKQLEERK